MAYQNKYKITMATKSGSISTLYLLEDGYIGDLIEYPATTIQLQYIPRSDDIFEPIYVSQLFIGIDVTDDLNNMPNLATLDDRKYLCQLYYNETIEWQGWAISDSVQFSFSTGRKELSFNAIDGLGMLEKILFPLPIDYVLSDFNTCLFYILNSLNAIAFPTNLNILTGISYYAEGMDNRNDVSWADPLVQSYLNYGTFINNDFIVENCLTILSKIVQGFGARLFQAQGKWFIVAVSQFAQEEYWFTEYDNAGLVVDSGLKNYNGLIDGFTNNTTGLFFVDNSQSKLIRKGYSKVEFNKNIEYPSNYITNWNLKQFEIGSPAYAWTENKNSGTMWIVAYPNLAFNSYYLDTGTIVSPYDMSIRPTYFPDIAFNEIIHISFTASVIAVGTITPDSMFILKIHLQTPSAFYTYTKDDTWELAGTQEYFQDFDANTLNVDLNLTLPPAPETGTIYFEYILAEAASPYWKSTVQATEVRNFVFTIEPAFVSYQCIGSLNDIDEYVFNPDFSIGFNDSYNGYYSYKGFLADSTGLNLKNWYRFEYIDEDYYRSLTQLVIRQYSNNLNKNVINIDSSFMSMNTEGGRFDASMRIKATDTDPAQISIENKQYIIGSTTIDLGNDIIQGTLLDINYQNVEANVYEIINSNSKPPFALGNAHLRSDGYVTSLDAYNASLTTINIYSLNTITVPDIGDVFYDDIECTTTFDGGYLWYKVVTVFPNTKVYQIRIDGVIIGIYT